MDRSLSLTKIYGSRLYAHRFPCRPSTCIRPNRRGTQTEGDVRLPLHNRRAPMSMASATIFSPANWRDVPTAKISLHFLLVCWTSMDYDPGRFCDNKDAAVIAINYERSISPPLHWTSFKVRNLSWYVLGLSTWRSSLSDSAITFSFPVMSIVRSSTNPCPARWSRFSVSWKIDEDTDHLRRLMNIAIPSINVNGGLRLRKNGKDSHDKSTKTKRI